MRINYRIKGLVFFLVLSFIVGGCIPILSASFKMNIGLQEKWEMKGTLLVSGQLGEQLTTYLIEQLGNNESLNQAGVKVDVKPLATDKNGNVPVELTMSGQGYDSFRQAFGDDALEIEEINGRRILNFNLNIFSGMTAQTTEFTISGGTILESNGQQVNATTVQWTNTTGQMIARMQEPSLIDYLPWVITGFCAFVVALILLIVVLGISRKKAASHRAIRSAASSKTSTGYNPFNDAPLSRPQSQMSISNRPAPIHPPASLPSTAQSKFCLQCGADIPVHSTFCPMCGAKQA